MPLWVLGGAGAGKGGLAGREAAGIKPSCPSPGLAEPASKQEEGEAGDGQVLGQGARDAVARRPAQRSLAEASSRV